MMGNTVPKGTLFASVDVLKKDIQQAIRDGKYTGFSILSAPIKTVQQMDRGIH